MLAVILSWEQETTLEVIICTIITMSLGVCLDVYLLQNTTQEERSKVKYLKWAVLAAAALYLLDSIDFKTQAAQYVKRRCIQGHEYWESSPDHPGGAWHGFVAIYENDGKLKTCK
jgi:hypothetical protein